MDESKTERGIFTSPVDLKLRKPEGDKHHMFAFDAKTAQQSEAYNEAIDLVTQSEGLRPFYQAGDNDAGVNLWEFWGDVDESLLAAMLPDIERAAQVLLSDDDDAIEALYEEWYSKE